MEKGYEKLLTEHKLVITDLPADAQTGIKAIKSIENVISMQEKKAAKNGKVFKIAADTMAKIKAYDKWVVREILDYIEEKDTNTPAPIVPAAIIIDALKADEPETKIKIDEPIVTDIADPDGILADKEFTEMFKSGKVECTMEELKTLCPTAEKIVWEDKTIPKGLTTTYYTLTEKSPNLFTLSKN